MQQGLFLFTWPDGYFLDVELKKRQQWFAEKYGKENCIMYSTDTITLQSIQEALQWGGLFSSKKLIICKWIPDDKIGTGKAGAVITKFFEGLLGEDDIHLSPDIILVFVSIDPDKRLRLYKILSEKASVKSFPELNEAKIAEFIKGQLGDYFEQRIADYLIQFVWKDLFRIEQECDKIKTYVKYTNGTKLTDADLGNIVYTPVQVNAFGVLDAITNGDLTTASRLIDASAQSMSPRPEFLGMLYWGLKHMIQTVDLYNHGTKSAKDIAAAIGMHFFPIVKNLKYLDFLRSHVQQLETVFHDLLDLDKNIKSWRFPQEGFWAEVKNILYKNIEIRN